MTSRPMRIVVGPARCSGCGRFVWYARAWNGMGLCWRDSDGLPHACKGGEE